MRVAVFSAKPYDRSFFDAANAGHGHELVYLEPRLDPQTAPLASGFKGICAFVNDDLDESTLRRLSLGGTELVALRSAGFNHVDLEAAGRLGLTVARVPAYSPYAVAEHSVGLMLALNRGLHRSRARVREGNFSLNGLLGFDMNGKTAGVVGTGAIGRIVTKILHGFGCTVLAHDVHESPDCLALGVRYVPLDELLAESDIVTLHCPLTPETEHLIGEQALARMKPGAMLINTSRGGLVDTAAVIEGLKNGQLGYLGLDVYEEEADLFFEDLSNAIIRDDLFMRLVTFPNVVVTAHQAYFTREALQNIAETTLANVAAFERGESSGNEVGAERVRG